MGDAVADRLRHSDSDHNETERVRAMAKREPRISETMNVSEAARQAGVKRSSLQSAVVKGIVPSWPDAGGVPHVLLKDVEKYAKNRPKSGPKTAGKR